MASDKIVFGLGNPGRRYCETRHNVGFRVLDALLKKNPKTWKSFEKSKSGSPPGLSCEVASPIGDPESKWYLIKPMTYMNASGECTKVVLEYFGVPARDSLVICDDVHLPLGSIRFRLRGSSGGQKGLGSIIHSIGSEDFPRLRIGVGSEKKGHHLSDFVLGSFEKEEKPVITKVIDLASTALMEWLETGTDVVMNKYN